MVHVSRGWRLAVCLTYLAIAFALTHTPSEDLGDIPDYLSDYILHGIGYAILGLLSVWVATTYQRGLTPRILFAIYLAILFYGIIDEQTQPWVGRGCELSDWVADAIGGLVGMTIALLVNRAITPRSALHPE